MNFPNAPRDEYVAVAGSRAYGTETESSDWDYRGFFMPDRASVLGYRDSKKNKVTQNASKDEALWEVRDYFRMAANANPNVLETLFVDEDRIVHEGEYASMVLENKERFLSRRIARTYFGYAFGNYKRILNQRTNPFAADGTVKSVFTPMSYDGKDAMHLVRLLRTGLECMKTGQLRIRRPEDRDYFLAIRRKEVPFADIEAEFKSTDSIFEAETAKSPLPKDPDEDYLNELCMSMMSMYTRDNVW